MKYIPTSQIIQDVEKAFGDTAIAADRACTEAIESSVYNWPRKTTRTNGEVVDSPRDIVDTGILRDTQRLDRTERDRYELSWPVNYAAEVHEGKTSKNGKHLPARRWTRVALGEDERAILNVPKYFRERINVRIKSRNFS